MFKLFKKNTNYVLFAVEFFTRNSEKLEKITRRKTIKLCESFGVAKREAISWHHNGRSLHNTQADDPSADCCIENLFFPFFLLTSSTNTYTHTHMHILPTNNTFRLFGRSLVVRCRLPMWTWDRVVCVSDPGLRS